MRSRRSGSGVGRCKYWVISHGRALLMNGRSAGLEEYIEGLSFLHFLEHGSLITIQEVQQTLSDKESGDKVSVYQYLTREMLMGSAGDRYARRLRFGNVGSDWRTDEVRYQRYVSATCLRNLCLRDS